jgi:hypothetical protein
MGKPAPEVERLLGWKIGVVALVLGATQALLMLLFPNSGEWSAVLLGLFLLAVLCAALVGFVASAKSAFDAWSRKPALIAMMMNVTAGALPLVAWLLYAGIINPR